MMKSEHQITSSQMQGLNKQALEHKLINIIQFIQLKQMSECPATCWQTMLQNNLSECSSIPEMQMSVQWQNCQLLHTDTS